MDTPPPALNTNGRLTIEVGGVRRIVPIGALPFTLGRSASSHLPLAHPQVSREHACIDCDAEGYHLRDVGSSHGTLVNGKPIVTARLRSGDRIALGTSENVILFEEIRPYIPLANHSPAKTIAKEGTTQHLIAQLSQSFTQPGPGTPNDLEHLSLFLKAAQRLNTHGAIKDVLCTMLEYTIRLTGAERGFVFLGDSADSFKLDCGQDSAGTVMQDSASISWSIVRDAAISQHEYILSDTSVDAARVRESVIIHAIRSVVAIPLRGQGANLLGLLYLDSRLTRNFTNTSREILRVIAHQAATLLENLRMIESERESVLIRKELEIAASIQRQIIPQTLPAFPGIQLEARTIPCTGVGGDFYDVIPVPDGVVAIVGDVCGKGIPAALLASMVQGMMYAQITAGASLLSAVSSVNSFICARAPGEKYLTLAILRYSRNLDGHANVELVNGGHVSPLIVRAGGTIETIVDGDLPVGLIPAATFHSIAVTLAVGDRIVLLSDGISEAEDPEGTQFGHTQLAQHLLQAAPLERSETSMTDILFNAVDLFCQGAHPQDDQTVLTLHRLD